MTWEAWLKFAQENGHVIDLLGHWTVLKASGGLRVAFYESGEVVRWREVPGAEVPESHREAWEAYLETLKGEKMTWEEFVRTIVAECPESKPWEDSVETGGDYFPFWFYKDGAIVNGENYETLTLDAWIAWGKYCETLKAEMEQNDCDCQGGCWKLVSKVKVEVEEEL